MRAYLYLVKLCIIPDMEPCGQSPSRVALDPKRSNVSLLTIGLRSLYRPGPSYGFVLVFCVALLDDELRSCNARRTLESPLSKRWLFQSSNSALALQICASKKEAFQFVNDLLEEKPGAARSSRGGGVPTAARVVTLCSHG